MTAGPVAVLLRRLQGRPGAPAGDHGDVLGRCEGGALAAALDLGARLGAPVVALAVGPARREDRVLAMALRAGCARAVRIDDGALGELDFLGLAQVIAPAVARIGARLVVCGDRSGDEGAGAVGPAVAELLGWPHLTRVGRLAVEGDAIVAIRRADATWQRVRAPWPLVLGVEAPPVAAAGGGAAAAAERDARDDRDDRDDLAGAAPARGRRAPRRARTPVPTLEELDLDDLGLDPRELAARRSAAGRLMQVRGRGASAVATSPAELIARLREDRLIGAPPAPAEGGS